MDPYEVNPSYLRANVEYDGREGPGTIVIDPNERYLYLVQSGGRATRYGVGVGREGFGWSGRRSSAASPNGRHGPRPAA